MAFLKHPIALSYFLMTEPKVDLISDRVAVVDLIHRVRFEYRSAQGTCVICGEERNTVEISAFIFYPGRNVYGVVCEIRSVWSQQFCQMCINSFFPVQDLIGYS